jgi:hypothetical protein
LWYKSATTPSCKPLAIAVITDRQRMEINF